MYIKDFRELVQLSILIVFLKDFNAIYYSHLLYYSAFHSLSLTITQFHINSTFPPLKISLYNLLVISLPLWVFQTKHIYLKIQSLRSTN